MANIALSEYGSKMIEILKQLRTLGGEVYDLQVAYEGAPSIERQNEIYDELWNSFNKATEYVTGQILEDAKETL